ncbi:MAG TPA: arylesterase [Oligoflexus sp.]|uniref:arylesterase n=1 Tax=Oligoflexus sp. TaxID=1971216 RepID=UPI002D7F5F59|nr:arylesterase [Oligoflexus sp.]HET9239745.1 arylesterase [Oligoflexus sp.]
MLLLFRRLMFALGLALVAIASPLAAKPVILSVGDSLTFGLGVPADKTWPALLEAKLKADGYPGVKVINAGSSGATTAFGVSTLKFHLKRGKPDLIIYALGANDGLRGIDPATTQKNLSTAMELIQAQGVKVLLLGMKAPPNYGEKFPKDFESSFIKVKDKYKPAFVPFFLEGVAGKAELNQADGIHPNEKGYEQVLALIYPKVKELL